MGERPGNLCQFYKEGSTFSFSSGDRQAQAPPAIGPAAIQAKLEHLRLGGALVHLPSAIVSAKSVRGGEVVITVTASMSISGEDSRQFNFKQT
ncbi:unnamed protein product, partial [Ascophyllum nodosum]